MAVVDQDAGTAYAVAHHDTAVYNSHIKKSAVGKLFQKLPVFLIMNQPAGQLGPHFGVIIKKVHIQILIRLIFFIYGAYPADYFAKGLSLAVGAVAPAQHHHPVVVPGVIPAGARRVVVEQDRLKSLRYF